MFFFLERWWSRVEGKKGRTRVSTADGVGSLFFKSLLSLLTLAFSTRTADALAAASLAAAAPTGSRSGWAGSYPGGGATGAAPVQVM